MDLTGERMIPELNQKDEVYLEHMSRYIFASQFVKNKIVLDIACGSGYGSDLLLKEGAKKIFSVDISQEAIEYCRKKYKNDKISFIVGDVKQIPVEDDSIDVVVSFETVEHISFEEQKKFMQEIKRVLKSDGMLIMSTPNTIVYPKNNPYHIKELSPNEFKKLLSGYFKRVNMFFQDDVWSSYFLSADVLKNKRVVKLDSGTIKGGKFGVDKPYNSMYLVAICGSSKVNMQGIVSMLEMKPRIANKQLANLLTQKDQEIINLNQSIQQKDQEINVIKSSKTWKLLGGYLRIRNFSWSYFKILYKEALAVLKREGFIIFIKYTFKYILYGRKYFLQIENILNDYQKWIQKNENWDERKIKKEIKDFKYKPKISIITPVYNIDLKWLDKCIQSVKNQFYENWELCLHDDASTKKETIRCLKKWEKQDKRIKISYGKVNQHISGASNEALKLATGEFIALLDDDDEFSSNALYENVKLLNKHPEADFIYSDEDKITEDGKREEPFFKPDWSPDLFLSMNYICHLGIYRKSIIDKIGGFRKGYEGSQDYDLVLRFIEKTTPEKIFHIPKILYHWRKIEGSAANSVDSKNYAYVAAKKALRDYVRRNNIIGEVENGYNIGTYRIRRKIINTEPKISIIIPFRDQVKILKKCVGSILNKTEYDNFEIILVDNQSKEKLTKNFLESIKNNPKLKILKYNKPFNFSAINNFAVKKARGEYLLFLNNDTEVINKEWLSAMVEHVQREEVGAVGAKLIYPNDTIQHAGIIMGLGIAGHAFKHMSINENGYFFQSNVIKNYNAVTAACMLTKKKLFESIGGFNEKNLAVAYNDVEYCLRVRKLGYLIVYTPYSKLYHYESLSRGNDNDLKHSNLKKYKRVIAEREYIRKRWKNIINNDPYYNPNLTLDREDFSLRID